jgi:hypothetical protein
VFDLICRMPAIAGNDFDAFNAGQATSGVPA